MPWIGGIGAVLGGAVLVCAAHAQEEGIEPFPVDTVLTRTQFLQLLPLVPVALLLATILLLRARNYPATRGTAWSCIASGTAWMAVHAVQELRNGWSPLSDAVALREESLGWMAFGAAFVVAGICLMIMADRSAMAHKEAADDRKSLREHPVALRGPGETPGA